MLSTFQKFSLLALSLSIIAGIAVLPALGQGRPLSATLTGSLEVPGPGDPDGSGTADFTLNEGQKRVCYSIEAADIILPATAAHIHAGAAGIAGSAVVTLTAPDFSGNASGCVENVDPELIKAIRQNPDEYYVNVHTSDYPDGAVRGQLEK